MIGRLTFIPATSRELYYIRLLLNIQVDCTSFEDIQTVEGHTYDTYREACGALGLLADDRGFIDAIHELTILGYRHVVRKLVANFLICSSLGDPLRVWEQTLLVLVDGIFYERMRALNSSG